MLSSTMEMLQWIITQLSHEFAITDLGALKYFLGISATRSSLDLFLSNQKYATDIIECAKMLKCNAFRTPSQMVQKLNSTGPSVANPTLYHSLERALQYLTFTRPNIVFSIQQMCLYMRKPRERHLHALKCILCYIHKTIDHRLCIHVSPTANLVSYFNFEWGNVPPIDAPCPNICVLHGQNLSIEELPKQWLKWDWSVIYLANYASLHKGNTCLLR